MRSFLVSFTLFFLPLCICAQSGRYWVGFTDKRCSDYSISDPSEFLSEKCLARRAKHQSPITTEDLPVCREYLSKLSAYELTIIYPLRWMNGVVIQCDQSRIGSFRSQPYIKEIKHIGLGIDVGGRNYSSNKFASITSSSSQKTYNRDQNKILGLDHMHRAGFSGKNVDVAIFDGGFVGVNTSLAFSELMRENRIVQTYDLINGGRSVYDMSDHGTSVLSVIAAHTGSYVGGARSANFYLFQTEDVKTEYSIEEYNWARAAEIADSIGISLINSSLGYFIFDDAKMNYTLSDMDGKSTVVSIAASKAAQRGILVVNSIGNVNQWWSRISSPADVDQVIAVGATDFSGQIANFSVRGPTTDNRIKPDVSAPGVSVVAFDGYGELTAVNGTSFACPLVSSLLIGLMEAHPRLTSSQLRQALKQSSSQKDQPDNIKGYGTPSFYSVQEYIQRVYNEFLPTQSDIALFPNPAQDHLYISFNEAPSDFVLQIHDNLGKQIFETEVKGGKTIYSTDLSSLRNQMYILTITFEDPTRARKREKVIKYK